MVMGWCTTAEAVVYERARPLKRPEEGESGSREGFIARIPAPSALAPLSILMLAQRRRRK